MTTMSTPLLTLNRLSLGDLAAQKGPCTTFLIPGATGGRESGSRAATLRGMLRSSPAIHQGTEFIEPIEDFVNHLEDEDGGPGIALFRSPTFFAACTAPNLEVNAVIRGKYFALAPLAAAVLAPREFYILALHRKNLHLFHYADGTCKAVPLPTDVPADMRTALGFDTPDHLLEGRSGGNRGTGAATAVQFGTSSDKESNLEYLHNYFRIVDRGLMGLVGQTPILLAGVHEDVAAYRRAAPKAMLLDSAIGGNIDFLTPAEIGVMAAQAALTHYRRMGSSVLAKQREMRHRERALSEVPAILEAAEAGRVHQLCAVDTFEPDTSGEDPVNEAIVATLRGEGEVYMLPAPLMMRGQPLAAILRY